jgi:isopentenyl-diphosphate delta-isomerase
MEHVDIVDKNNTILYQTSKEEAHKKGLLHRTVIAEVIDPEGNFILVKQNDHKQDAGQYVSPVGGHVQAGESADDAMKREALEEAGLKDFAWKFVGQRIYNRKVIGRHENHLFLVYEIYSDKELILNDESVSYKRFQPREIHLQLMTNPSLFGDAFHFVIQHFYAQFLESVT